KRKHRTYHEDTILETHSIPFPVVPGCLGGRATGRCSDTGATRTSTVCGAEHHGSGRQRLPNSIRHGPSPNEQRELLALSGVPANARESLSVGRQVRSGDRPPILPGGGVCGPHEPAVHPAGHVPDG